MDFTLKDLIRSGSFIIALFFFTAGATHAQSGQHSAPWGDAAKSQGGGDQGSTPPKTQESPPAQATGFLPSATPEGDSRSCAFTTPEQESLLCKAIRIFYGRDTPRGPNRDVEENISAGGAGG